MKSTTQHLSFWLLAGLALTEQGQAKYVQSLKGGIKPDHDKSRALTISFSWNVDVCHKVSNSEYKTKRVLFFVSWFHTMMMGDKRGRCGQMCDSFCGPTCQQVLVSPDAATCNCGTTMCDTNAVCSESQCSCDAGYGGNGTSCHKCVGLNNETLDTNLCSAIIQNGLPGNVKRTDFKEFIRTDLWNTTLQGLKGVPLKYFDPNNYNFDVIADDFLDFMYDNKTFSPQDCIGIQEMLNFTYVSRRNLAARSDEDKALSQLDRDLLDMSSDCKDRIYEMAINLISILFNTIPAGPKIIQYALSKPALKSLLQSKILTTVAKAGQGSVPNLINMWGGIAINFLTSITWSDIEGAARDVIVELDFADYLSLVLTMTSTFLFWGASGGSAVVLLILSNASSAIGFVSAAWAFFNKNNCFGEIRSEDCDTFQTSGEQGKTTSIVNMKKTSGTFNLQYEMYENPDQLEVFYEGNIIYTTGGLVSDYNSVNITYSGLSQLITVVITAPNDGTGWDVNISCP